MIPNLMTVLSGFIGYLIGIANEEEIPKYEKWIKIWQKLVAVSLGLLFPLFSPFAFIMYLETDRKKEFLNSVAIGATAIINSWIGLSLIAMYSLISFRHKNLKETTKDVAISLIVFISLYLISNVHDLMVVCAH